MVFSSDDHILMKALRIEKGYGAKRLLKERDVAHLWESLMEEWAALDKVIVELAVQQWRGRLRVCIEAEGDNFEYQMH